MLEGKKWGHARQVPRVSVLIPSRNRPESLRCCVQSVAAQDYPDIAIVLGDDGSEPPIREKDFGQLKNPVRVIRSDRPRGVIEMRRRLLEAAESDVVIFLDDDVTLRDSDSFSRIAGLFDVEDPPGLVAPTVVDNLRGERRVLNPGAGRSGKHESITEAGGFIGAAFAVVKDAVCRDETSWIVSGYGHEEIEFAYMITGNGYRMVCDSSITIDHHRSSAGLPRQEGGKRFRSAVRNRLTLARAYLPLPYRATHLLFWIVRYLLMALRRRMLPAYLNGVREGLRTPVDPGRVLPPGTVTYLRRTGGRIWY